jgi:hypothetical protein
MVIPWTENIYKEVEEFGKGLWQRYIRDELCDFKNRDLRGKKSKRIRKRANKKGKKVERQSRNERPNVRKCELIEEIQVRKDSREKTSME